MIIMMLTIQIKAAVVITEIHYNPLDAEVNGITADGEMCEFVEIKNTGDKSVDLSGYSFTEGIAFVFPGGVTIEPGKFKVIAKDQACFESRYGFKPDGLFSSGNLKNSGEEVKLTDASGTVVDNVDYKDASPWPVEPDGSGNSLVPVDSNRVGDPDLPSTWRASTKIHGSPNADDPQSTSPKVLINEILSNTDSAGSDYIELYNSSSADANISGWYLTDNSKRPKKFKIPANTVIPKGGYKLFTADAFNADTSGFQFDSHGEEVFVFEADASGNLTGYNHGFTFGEVENNISFGRYVNSIGETHFVPMATSTPGAANSNPLVGKIIITEIMYNAPDGIEYLEIQNISNDTISLFDPDNVSNTWKVSGIGFDFPPNKKIAPGQIMLLIDDTTTVDDFRSKYSVDSKVPILTYPSTLQGNGETIKIEKAEKSYVDPDLITVVPYMLIDWVTYGSSSPWPTEADGSGKSLNRVKNNAYGNDPANWNAGSPTPGSHTVAVKYRNNSYSPLSNIRVSITSSPQNHSFFLSIFMPKAEMVSVDLFDCKGRLLNRLTKKQLQAGQNILKLNSAQINSNNLLFLRVKSSDKILYTDKLLISN